MRELTSQEFKDKIFDYSTETNFKSKSEKPVIIDFHAEWCGPCKMLSPVLNEVAEENSEIEIYKVNVDNEHEVASKFKVRSIPTLLFVPVDGEPDLHVGMMPKNIIEDKIRDFLKVNA